MSGRGVSMLTDVIMLTGLERAFIKVKAASASTCWRLYGKESATGFNG